MLDLLLFKMHIGDIDTNIEYAKAFSFADDTRIGHQIKNEEDVCKLQGDIDTLLTWESTNDRSLNGEKHELLWYGRKHLRYLHHIIFCDHPIEESKHVRDLGVMSSDATSFHHISKVG